MIIAGCSPQQKEGEDNDQTSKIKAIETEKTPEVTVMELQPSTFSHEIVSNGKATARAKVDVNFQTQGIITAIYVRNG